MYGALPGVLWNRGTKVFIPGEQGNEYLQMKETWEQRQFLGTGNIGNEDFLILENRGKSDLFEGNKGTGTPGRATSMP